MVSTEKIQKKTQWQTGYCRSCGTDDVPVTTCSRPTGSPMNDATADFCKYCYGSLAGNSYWWPGQYGGSTLRTMVEVAHVLERSVLEGVRAMLSANETLT